MKYQKTKAHQIYKLNNGIVVPGVTTVVNVWGANKNALIGWARKEALAGKDPYKIRDKAADVGTIAHFMIQCHLLNKEPDLSEFAPADVDKAENCFINFLDWKDKHNVKVHNVEKQRISELFQYGGTCDFDGEVDDELAVVDYKSSKDIYPEMKVQGAGLIQLYHEDHNIFPAFYVLQLGQTDGEFHYAKIEDLSKYWDIFYHLREIYRLQKELGM